jgi:hypothetical protein
MFYVETSIPTFVELTHFPSSALSAPIELVHGQMAKPAQAGLGVPWVWAKNIPKSG